MHVEIKTATVTNARDYKGEQYGEQQAALVTSGDFPIPFKINRKVSEPLKPGLYDLDGSGFGTDQHGNLKLNKVRLSPRSAPAPAKS